MSSPSKLFESLRDMYLRYLDSPFDLRYADLTAERRDLLDQDGRIYRHPLIEPVPAYASTGQPFPQVAQSVFGSWAPQETTEVADFISQGLFPPHLNMYLHQREVVEEVLVNGNDAVVTTGTGSGKTECFLLPVVSSIVRESAGWTAPGQRPPQWNWWEHFTVQGTRRRWAPRVSQRSHETRPAAVRALILYPLNALVEDQLARLRQALDCLGARAWLDTNRGGNRIYFGRYTGQTPISGAPNSSNIGRLRQELRRIDADARAVAGSVAEGFFQKLDGAEMWSRWDMQESPPDVLITNYSMLNIMLMRSIEATIFDQTRQWLQADTTRQFFLVVDELHTYRGTPGTEVAYLLRALLDRLGLPPDSDQLRIISSSASVASGAAGLDYLEQFFGRDRGRFRVIGGPQYVVPPSPTATASLAAQLGALQQFGRDLETGGVPALPQAASALATAAGLNPGPGGVPSQEVVATTLEHIEAPDALRLACQHNGEMMPRHPGELAPLLFPGANPQDALEATEGVLAALTGARHASGLAPLPMRAHLMFRNLQGLWVCTNPRCNQVTNRAGQCPVGSLHYVPALTCPCGSRILELLYCEACGETYCGGYRRETGNPNEWYLSPDHPNLESAPDLASPRSRLRDATRVFGPAGPLSLPASGELDARMACGARRGRVWTSSARRVGL